MMGYDLIGEVRRSTAEETGEPVSRATASVIVDRMCDAFVMKVEGAGIDYAVQEMPDVARWLQWRWTGAEGRELRESMDRLEVRREA